MGFLSWLFKEEDPPEPLVFGALLQCPHGSKKNYLFVETDNLDIEHLPQAYVDDCKAYKNIMPFGECLSGSLCEYKMELEKQWENPEPQTMLVNGKEIITTKSVLLCKAEGVGIKAIKSGQDRVFAEQVLLYAEMDAKYPGLSEILKDPYGSLYLTEGMYEKAIQFLEDRLKHNGGELFLPTIYDKDNPEGDIIRGILARLLTDCDASAFDRLINGLETAGYQNGMDEDAGYDVHTLNAEMIEMLRRDCKKTAEKIETDENARWMEEHKKFMTIFADSVTEFAYGVAIYHSATAKERSQGRDEVEETGEESNGEVEKTAEQENGENAKIEGESGSDPVDVELKYKDGWTATQKAEADAKVRALSDAETIKTSVNRSGTSAASRYKSAYGDASVPSGYDVDHTIDLQLGGADDILNMNPLDMSVNRSLGVQIKNAIKLYPDGTVFGQFTIH